MPFRCGGFGSSTCQSQERVAFDLSEAIDDESGGGSGIGEPANGRLYVPGVADGGRGIADRAESST